MWLPKTEEEIKALSKEREISARLLSIFGTLFMFAVVILIAKYIGFKDAPAYVGPTYTWSQIVYSIPVFGIVCLIMGVVMYFALRKHKQISSLICDKCGKIKRYDKIENCDCGGHFVFLEEMKWIEDEETENDNDETKTNT